MLNKESLSVQIYMICHSKTEQNKTKPHSNYVNNRRILYMGGHKDLETFCIYKGNSLKVPPEEIKCGREKSQMFVSLTAEASVLLP